MNMSHSKKIIEFCQEYDSDILLADGFDEAFLGVGSVFHGEPIAVYDRDKCIEILTDDFKRQATKEPPSDNDVNEEIDFYEQAMDYFSYNVEGSYVGEKTPIFLTPFS